MKTASTKESHKRSRLIYKKTYAKKKFDCKYVCVKLLLYLKQKRKFSMSTVYYNNASIKLNITYLRFFAIYLHKIQQ